MKKTLIAILLVFLIASSYACLLLDKQLYFYGRNAFDLYNDIPLKIKPVFFYDFEGGSYLGDDMGMSIIARGKNLYRNGINLDIKKIERYGYSNNKVIAEIENTENQIVYVESSGSEDGSQVQANFLGGETNINDYKWVDITNVDLIRTDYVLRNWAVMISIATSIAIILFFYAKIK